MEAEIFNKLAEYGFLGLILALVGWALYQKDKQLTECYKERAEDGKLILKDLNEFRTTMAEHLRAGADRTAAMQKVGDAIQLQAPMLARLERMLEELRK